MTNLAARVRRYRRPPAAVDAGRRRRGRRVGRRRLGGAAAAAARTRRRRRPRARRRGAPQSPAARQPPTATRRSAARWPRESGVPIDAARVDVAAAAARGALLGGGGGARRPLRLLRAGADRAAAPTPSPWRTPATTRPRPCCCGCCAAPAPAGLRGALPRARRRGAAAPRPVAATSCAPTSDPRRDLGGGRDQRRPGHPPQPDPPRPAAAACPRLPARRRAGSWPGRPTLAHDDDAYLDRRGRHRRGRGRRPKGSGGCCSTRAALARPAGGSRPPGGADRRSRRPAPPAAVRLADVDRVLAACAGPRGRPAARSPGSAWNVFPRIAVLFSRGAEPPVERIPPRTLEVPGEVEVPECRRRMAGACRRADTARRARP